MLGRKKINAKKERLITLIIKAKLHEEILVQILGMLV